MRSAVPHRLKKRVLRASLSTYPYSIVKDSRIAKIGSARVPEAVHTADTRDSSAEIGGADRDRTDDPLLAKQMLSQLSYSPGGRRSGGIEN